MNATRILNKSQAEAVYSAMCALNKVGGRLVATFEQDGAVHVAETRHSIEIWLAGGGSVESYADQSGFVAAYGLRPQATRAAEMARAMAAVDRTYDIDTIADGQSAVATAFATAYGLQQG